MSAATADRVPAQVPAGPTLRARICALAVLVALAALATYAVFAGPTTVAVKVPASSPSHATQPAPGQEPGEGGGERGD
jgi:hypothetical protein